MKTLVIYDSVFGNTEKIAQAMGAALGVETLRVSAVKLEDLAGVTLLIAGSPTRGFRPTPLMTAFLASIPAGSLKGVTVTAFDTRVPMDGKNIPGFLRVMVKLFGYAAEKLAKTLQQKGGTLTQSPAGFMVLDSEGPLKEGELERAAAWATKAGG
jgi:flavodoxin I